MYNVVKYVSSKKIDADENKNCTFQQCYKLCSKKSKSSLYKWK